VHGLFARNYSRPDTTGRRGYSQATITAAAFVVQSSDHNLRVSQSHASAEVGRQRRSKTIQDIFIDVRKGDFSTDAANTPPADDAMASNILWRFLASAAIAATCSHIEQIRLDYMAAAYAARQDIPGGDLDMLAALGAGEFAPTPQGLQSLKNVLLARSKVPPLRQGSVVVCDRESQSYKVASAGNNSFMLEEGITQERMTWGTPRLDQLCDAATSKLQRAMTRHDIFVGSAGRRPAKLEDWDLDLITYLQDHALESIGVGGDLNNCSVEKLFDPFIGHGSPMPCLYAPMNSVCAVQSQSGAMISASETPLKNPLPGLILKFDSRHTTERVPRNRKLPAGISKAVPLQPYDDIRRVASVCADLSYLNNYPGGEGPPGVQGTAIPASGYGPRSIHTALTASARDDNRSSLPHLKVETAGMMLAPPLAEGNATVQYANPIPRAPETGNLGNGSLPAPALHNASIHASGLLTQVTTTCDNSHLSACAAAKLQIGQLAAMLQDPANT
jgi:hypothetical protein